MRTNIRVKTSKFENTFFIIFFLVGSLFFWIGAGIFYFNQTFIHDAQKVQATITNVTSHNDSRTVYVTYEVGGQVYERPLSYYSSSMHIGKSIIVYYKEGDPTKIDVEMIALPIVFMLLGGVFALVGSIGGIHQMRKKILHQKLKKEGRLIYANVYEVSVNSNMSVNRRHPYVVKCMYRDYDGMPYYFESENLWDNPTELVEGKEIPVYVDPVHYSKYYVDMKQVIEEQGYIMNE